jgi:hypothetical protein
LSAAGCSHALSSADCGQSFVPGSGLLALVGAPASLDREAGPDSQPQDRGPAEGYAAQGDISLNELPNPDPDATKFDRQRCMDFMMGMGP